MFEFAVLMFITIASGAGVTFGTLGMLAWLERRFGFPRLG